jgi:hypothetical protein
MLMMNRVIGTVAKMGGVPAVQPAFTDSFEDLIQYNAQYVCGPGESIYYPRPPRASIHDFARNSIADTFRGDWLLQLDSDHSFDPDLLHRLIRVADRTGADVVSGFYQYKDPPHSPVLFVKGEGESPRPLMDWDDSIEALRIYSAGAGCLFVRRPVFDRIRKELNESPFTRIGALGEDHSFFLRLHKLEIEAVAAMQVECHHLQTRAVTRRDYDRDALEIAPGEPVKGYR